MSEKILSRKWDVWQERLGWEGNSHLLGKMCPQNLGKEIYSWVVIVRCDQMMGMSRMCWSILSDKGLYLCHSKWRRPRRGCQAMGQECAGGARLLQIWEINPSVRGEIDCFVREVCWRQVTRSVSWSMRDWLFAGLRGFMSSYQTLKIRPRLATNIWSWAESNVYLANRWGNCLYDLNTNKDDRFGIQPPAIYTLPCKQPLLASIQRKVFPSIKYQTRLLHLHLEEKFLNKWSSFIFGVQIIQQQQLSPC